MSNIELYRAFSNAIVSALLITTLVAATFMVFEPIVSRGQATNTFTVKQTISGEISFLVEAQATTMVGSINGLTGGYATGTAFAVVQTNDPDGYNMTIRFPYATTSGMQGDATATFINNYTTATSSGVPDYGWVDNGAAGASEFGYTVRASTTADLDQTFRNNGTKCNDNTGGDVNYKCWINGSTTAETIVNRTSGAAPTGATTTIRFKVAVPSNPTPALDADTYTATATLTATNN